MWVLTTALPTDADKNYVYTNRKPWWGDSSSWINVDIAADPLDKSSVLVSHLVCAFCMVFKMNTTSMSNLLPKGTM